MTLRGLAWAPLTTPSDKRIQIYSYSRCSKKTIFHKRATQSSPAVIFWGFLCTWPHTYHLFRMEIETVVVYFSSQCSDWIGIPEQGNYRSFHYERRAHRGPDGTKRGAALALYHYMFARCIDKALYMQQESQSYFSDTKRSLFKAT